VDFRENIQVDKINAQIGRLYERDEATTPRRATAVAGGNTSLLVATLEQGRLSKPSKRSKGLSKDPLQKMAVIHNSSACS